MSNQAISKHVLRETIESHLSSYSDVLGEEDPEMIVFHFISRIVLPLAPEAIKNPAGEDIRAGNSLLFEDCDLDLDEPFLDFGFEGCFETRMTATGRTIAQTCGKEEITPTQWGIFS